MSEENGIFFFRWTGNTRAVFLEICVLKIQNIDNTHIRSLVWREGIWDNYTYEGQAVWPSSDDFYAHLNEFGNRPIFNIQ